MLRLVDYWAGWCHPCKLMEPVLEEIEKEMAGKIEVEKINVDEEPEKSQAAGVMSIPTYVLIRDGEEMDRKIGAFPKDAFTEWIQKHL